jgi:hypothetical protein
MGIDGVATAQDRALQEDRKLLITHRFLDAHETLGHGAQTKASKALLSA